MPSPGQPPAGGYPAYPPPQGVYGAAAAASPHPSRPPPLGQFPGAGYSPLPVPSPFAPPYGAQPQPQPQPQPQSYPYGAQPLSPYQLSPFPYGAGGGGIYPPPPAPYAVFPPTPPSLGYGPPQRIPWDGAPDAQALRRAMKGYGTNEPELIRVLADKDPLQVSAIRDAYRAVVGRDLDKDLRGDTSGHFLYGLLALARGPALADAHAVSEAIDRLGTNEALLNDVLLGRSNADMNAIRAAYHQAFGKDMAREVSSDLSMKTQRHFDMVMAARRAEDSEPVDPVRVDMDVDGLYGATEGKIGTDELRVVEILSYRNDAQIRAISAAYHHKYRRPLAEVIRKEFSGHMQDALLFQLRHAEDRYMHAAELLEASMRGLGTKDRLLVGRVVRFHWNRHELANIKMAYQQLMSMQRMNLNLAQRIRGETSGNQCRLLLACLGEPWA